MRSPVAADFLDEAERLGFRFTCADCCYHLPKADRCAHEWPDELHREPPRPDQVPGIVVFCKEFELR